MPNTNTIRMQILFRRDFSYNWELHKDVVPAAGEPCFVIDKNILKIGDGVTTFENLVPINGANAEISADGTSIVLEDGVFKLAGFDAAEVGAQPRKKADGTIEWVVPSTEVINTLQTDVKTLKTNVSALQDEVAGLKEIVTPSGEGAVTLLERIEGLETKMDGTGDGTVDAKIDAKINEFANRITDDGTINTIQELFNYVANHGGEIETIVNDITTLQSLVGSEPVSEQIAVAMKNSGHITKEEATTTLLSKVEAKATLEHVKYEIANTPVGTLVDYRDDEIRVMVPADAQYHKQTVGAGGDPNNYYMTFKTYVPNDNVVGYREHLGDQVDSEILTTFSVDEYGRRYQPTWLALAKYDEASNTWTYYGANSSKTKYIGWNYRIDWYDADGVMVASDSVRINLSNEECHHAIEPYYMTSIVKGIQVNGTLLEAVDGIVDIHIAEQTLGVKGSDEIDVAEDGTLTIKEISFDKIVQSADTVIVMDGGSAG